MTRLVDSPRRASGRRLVLAIALALVAGACSEVSRDDLAERYDTRGDGIEADAPRLPPAGAAPDPNAPRARGIDCPFDTTTLPEVECGEIDMPGRGVDPDFEVSVTYARFVAQGTGADLRSDPVVYLHGGPGASILSDVAYWYESIAAPHIHRRDVIFYDQRGAGFSGPLPTCHEVHDVGNRVYGEAIDHRLLEGPFVAAMRECGVKFAERTEVDLTAFTSQIHAADLADLRRALGFDRYNIHGSSYGTRLAQAVMRDHPDGVRSLVLSGVYPIDVNLTGYVPVAMETSLQVVFDACAADPVCNEALPDPWGALEDLVAGLDRNPRTVKVPDTVSSDFSLVVDGTDLLTALHQHLYTGLDAATVPDLLIDYGDGDGRRLDRLLANSLYDLADVAAFVAVQCADEAPFTTPADLDRPLSYPMLAAVDHAPSLTGRLLPEVCSSWETASPDPIRNEAVSWDVPTLLLSGALDPITPASWGWLLADRLPNARHIVSNTLAHDSDEGFCLTGIIGDFVDRPDGPVDSGCTAWEQHLTVDNLAQRFVDRTAPTLVDVEIDLGAGYRPVTLPDWFGEYAGATHLRWRIIDSFDPTVLIVSSGGDVDTDLTQYLDVPGDARFEPSPTGSEPDGWTRSVMTTSGVDIVRYRHTAAKVQVALVAENGEEAALEDAVLLPAVESIGSSR